MFSEQIEKALINIGITILGSFENKRQIKLFLRISNAKTWQTVVERILRASGSSWSVHICCELIIKNNKMQYMWNFIIQSKDLSSAAQEICQLINPINSNMVVYEGRPTSPKAAPFPANLSDEVLRRVSLGGIVNEFGMVTVMPLLGEEGRNEAKGGLHEKGKSPKGVHITKAF